MIDFIKGRIISKKPTYVLLDVNGVGFGLNIPVSTYTRLGERNREQELHSWLVVREDSLNLYGFATTDERRMFGLLINISGVGPAMALGILSSLSVDGFKRAIINGDATTLVSIPGIGRKKAERLLLELKDRVEDVPPGVERPLPAGKIGDEAVSALTSLGSKHAEAAKAVREAGRILGERAALEDIIKEALKHL